MYVNVEAMGGVPEQLNNNIDRMLWTESTGLAVIWQIRTTLKKFQTQPSVTYIWKQQLYTRDNLMATERSNRSDKISTDNIPLYKRDAASRK